MKKLKRTIMLLALGAGAGFAHAQTGFPAQPVSLVVPFAAGSGADTVARVLAEGLEDEWRTSVIVVNRPGAGGQISMQHVARAKPDGYTLGITSSGTLAINPSIYKDIKYDSLKSFEQVSILAEVPFVVVVKNPSERMDLTSWIEHAKKHPGSVSIGNAGIGSHQYLAAHQFAKSAGIELNMIPYAGGPAMAADLVGGSLDLVLDNTIVQLPFINGGRVKGLGISTESRVDFLPHIPTISEAGLPGYREIAWYGLAAPAGTPKEIVKAIQEASVKALRKPEVTKKLNDTGVTVVVSTPEAATEMLRQDIVRFKGLVEEIGLNPK